MSELNLMDMKAKQIQLLQQNPTGLIIEAALCPEPLWLARGKGAPAYTLFNQNDSDLVEKGPWLIELDPQADIAKIALEKDPQGHACLWFSSSLASSVLCQLLQQRVYAELPSGAISRFRWYDPRVLHFYLSDTTPERQAEFLSPFEQLLYTPLNPFDSKTHWMSWQKQQQADGLFQASLIAFEPAKENL